MDSRTTIDSLPNELLISILSKLPTQSLLPLVAVSRRFYSVTLRILKQRLQRATSLPDRRLILECYHPSAKLSTPYLYCTYLYTDSLDGVGEAGPEARETDPSSPRPVTLGGLRGIYSHFRPVVQDENRRGRARYPRRQSGVHGAPGQPAEAGSSQPQRPAPEAEVEAEETRPWHDVYLDEGELLSQLCTVTNLVRLGPRPGLFRSHVNVSDGLIRLWRDWLAEQAAVTASGGGGGGGGDDHKDSDSVLWADAACNVGIRFRVAEKDISGEHPVLVGSDEQLPAAYRLEFEELLVRTSTLLMMAEKSEVQGDAAEGFWFEQNGAVSYPTMFVQWRLAPSDYLPILHLGPVLAMAGGR